MGHHPGGFRVVAGAHRIGCVLSARTRTATSEPVKPLGEGDKAISASTTAYTVVNPTLADLAQSPYSPGLGQGVCDLGQTCGVRDSRKAVSLLGEGDASLARLTGNVLVAVQDHLGGEGRMPADLD